MHAGSSLAMQSLHRAPAPCCDAKNGAGGGRARAVWGQLTRRAPGAESAAAGAWSSGNQHVVNPPAIAMALPAPKLSRDYCALFICLMCELFWLQTTEGRGRRNNLSFEGWWHRAPALSTVSAQPSLPPRSKGFGHEIKLRVKTLESLPLPLCC